MKLYMALIFLGTYLSSFIGYGIYHTATGMAKIIGPLVCALFIGFGLIRLIGLIVSNYQLDQAVESAVQKRHGFSMKELLSK